MCVCVWIGLFCLCFRNEGPADAEVFDVFSESYRTIEEVLKLIGAQ